MVLTIRVSSFVVPPRQFKNNHYITVLADFEPFPGAMVKLEVLGQSPALLFWGRIEDVLETKKIQQHFRNGLTAPIKLDNWKNLSRNQMDYLREVNDLLHWGEENSIHVDTEYNPQTEGFIVSDLEVKPV